MGELFGTDYRGARFVDADFSGAVFRDVNLTGAKVIGALGLHALFDEEWAHHGFVVRDMAEIG